MPRLFSGGSFLSPQGPVLPGPAQRTALANVWPGVVQAALPSGVVVVGALTASQIANAANDCPLVMASSGLVNAQNDPAFAVWWNQTASFNAGANQADPANPTYNLYDYQHNRFSQPLVAATTWRLLFSFGGTPQAFDSVAVLGHNFGVIGGLTVTMKVADDAAFSTNLRTVATWSPGTSTKRLVKLALGGGTDAYSNVRYALLEITTAGTAFIPQVGEVLFSSRRQMVRGALLPYDPDALSRRTADFVSRNGVTTRYVFFKGQANLVGDIVVENAADAAIISSWWSDSGFGIYPYLWVERPNSAPSLAYMMFFAGDTRFPFLANAARKWSFAAVENGSPFAGNEA